MCGHYCPDFAIFGIRLKELEARKQAAAPEPLIPSQP
jgi:hypothetical protein